MKVRINKLHELRTKNQGKLYWSVDFTPNIEGVTKASVWDEKIKNSLKEGYEAEIKYSFKNNYLNITEAQLIEGSKPEEVKKLSLDEAKKTYKECFDFIKDTYKDLLLDPNFNGKLDFTASVHTLFMTVTRRDH